MKKIVCLKIETGVDAFMAEEWRHVLMVLQLSRAANINHLPELEMSSEFTENFLTDLDIFPCMIYVVLATKY